MFLDTIFVDNVPPISSYRPTVWNDTTNHGAHKVSKYIIGPKYAQLELSNRNSHSKA